MWYGVMMLFVSEHDHRIPEKDALWETRVILVAAGHEEEALATAERLAKAREHEYLNVHGELVRWKFVRVVGLCEILDEQLADGTEIFHRFLGKEDMERLPTYGEKGPEPSAPRP